MHLAGSCLAAGRGQADEAETYASAAEEVSASLRYGQEMVYAARAFCCQAVADYLGMADALSPWKDDSALDARSRLSAVLWKSLLLEGLVGSGQLGLATDVLESLRADCAEVRYLRPALAWLEGWLAEQRGAL
jgi:hypothetical protein